MYWYARKSFAYACVAKIKNLISVLKCRQVVGITMLSANTISVPVNLRGLQISYRNILYSERRKGMQKQQQFSQQWPKERLDWKHRLYHPLSLPCNTSGHKYLCVQTLVSKGIPVLQITQALKPFHVLICLGSFLLRLGALQGATPAACTALSTLPVLFHLRCLCCSHCHI